MPNMFTVVLRRKSKINSKYLGFRSMKYDPSLLGVMLKFPENIAEKKFGCFLSVFKCVSNRVPPTFIVIMVLGSLECAAPLECTESAGESRPAGSSCSSPWLASRSNSAEVYEEDVGLDLTDILASEFVSVAPGLFMVCAPEKLGTGRGLSRPLH